MNYLQNRKVKKTNPFSIILGAVLIFVVFYFRVPLFRVFSSSASFIFRPVLAASNKVGENFKNFRAYFSSKNGLLLENENLKLKLGENDARMSNYNSILAENEILKEILGRKNEGVTMVLAAILGKPSRSLYDTLILDTGEKQNIKVGDIVFAFGNIPIGKVIETHPDSSKVILFSNPGEKTEVVISQKNLYLELVGRGGGNFEIILPRDVEITKGDEAILPGIFPYVVAVVETVLSDPRDTFTKALLVTPVNIQELKFVEVETSP